MVQSYSCVRFLARNRLHRSGTLAAFFQDESYQQIHDLFKTSKKPAPLCSGRAAGSLAFGLKKFLYKIGKIW